MALGKPQLFSVKYSSEKIQSSNIVETLKFTTEEEAYIYTTIVLQCLLSK